MARTVAAAALADVRDTAIVGPDAGPAGLALSQPGQESLNAYSLLFGVPKPKSL
jgi:hypothetical protein